jgi:thiol-disulfide isomerase/thioredoxin
MSFTSFSKLAACALLCALGAACSLDGASKERATRAKTSGQRPPRTSLPMPPAAPAHSTDGAAATPAGWTGLDGRRAALEDYRGQVVVLDFYATYCPPCIKGIPHLVELQRRYGPQGMKVVGLNVGGKEDQLKVPALVRRFQIQYQLATPDDETVGLYLAQDDTIPQTFVFDRRGQLVRHFVGYDEEVGRELERAIEGALAEKAD